MYTKCSQNIKLSSKQNSYLAEIVEQKYNRSIL
jgi:hypothetical protein